MNYVLIFVLLSTIIIGVYKILFTTPLIVKIKDRFKYYRNKDNNRVLIDTYKKLTIVISDDYVLKYYSEIIDDERRFLLLKSLMLKDYVSNYTQKINYKKSLIVYKQKQK